MLSFGSYKPKSLKIFKNINKIQLQIINVSDASSIKNNFHVFVGKFVEIFFLEFALQLVVIQDQ